MNIVEGDVFQIGNHKLACGDCRDKELMSKLVQNHRINLILTDPPYGVGYVENKSEMNSAVQNHAIIANDQEQSEEEYSQFTHLWLEAIKPYLADTNSMYIFNTDRMLFALREGMMRSKFKMSQLLIWIKNQAVMGRLDYLPQHELIVYGWHGKHTFYKSKDKSLLFYPRPTKNNLHPTMKPIPLLRHLILNSSQVSDVVLDPFGGSGSTLIACEQTKRNCLMTEIDARYCEIILNRAEKITGLKAIKN